MLQAVKKNGGYDGALIEKALNYATECHKGQCRRSGEPYIEHPIQVALILIDLGMDTESIVAALLHDVVEDTEVTNETIQKLFGKEVALLVEGVTKLGKIPYYSREEQQAENLRKMLFAMAQDVRVIIIKLADRLHNMRTIDSLREQKRRDISLETIEVYAPIAHRLGIRGVKEELEDLCIRQLDPVGYADILNALTLRKNERQQFLQSIEQKIKQKVDEAIGKDTHIEGRVKSIHGIYRKMYMQGKSFDEIYDIYAVRVIVDTVNECYNVLGMIHDMFRPIPGRFKDYISTPKQNQYQSLHTTVIESKGIPFEVQIRTWEMHHTAEFGIAAHWKYKVGIRSGKDSDMEQRLSWIRQLLEAQRESGEADELVNSIKNDLTLDEVFVVTPKGDVVSLPNGATIIDFAYAIHTAVGNRMVGAKVDGRMVPLDYQVKNGEIIEILTTHQAGRGPARDWLNIAKTSEARSKIRAWFKKEKRDENIAEGKLLLEREIRTNLVGLNDDQRQEIYEHFAKAYHCNSVDDFFASVGYGGILLSRLMPRVREYYNAHFRHAQPAPAPEMKPARAPRKAADGVVVEGIDNCLIRFSNCCGPLPGDDIIGFVTRGHGVSIHKRDCPNVPKPLSSCEQPERWLPAHWTSSAGRSFKATLYVLGLDRPSMVADISLALTAMRVPLHSLNAKTTRDGNCEIIFTVSAEGTEHLNNIIARINKISDVITVDRTGN